MRCARDMCLRTRYVCCANEDFYHIAFTAGKYIAFVVRQKYRIAKQYIDKGK